MNTLRVFVGLMLLLCIGMQPVEAHPGGLDSRGGHRNRKTGEYHKHRQVEAVETEEESADDVKATADEVINRVDSASTRSALTAEVRRLRSRIQELTRENTELRKQLKGRNARGRNTRVIPQPVSTIRPYTGKLYRSSQVYDGDTLKDAHVKIADFNTRGEIWPGILITDDGVFSTLDLRLAGIDTPEKRTKNQREKALAMKAQAKLVDLMMGQANGHFFVKNPKLGKYAGRVVCEVWIRNPRDGSALNVSQAMLDAKMAKPYAGGKRPTW